MTTTTGTNSAISPVIIGASCAAFMNILDGTIVTVSLPVIVYEFSVDTSLGIYIVLAYTIMLAGTVLMFGKIADSVGIRKVMIAGFLLFTASSLMCGLAPSLSILIVGRLFQGIGGGMLSATSLGAIGYYLAPERRGWGVGIISAASALGIMLGGPIGGFISESMGWQWIFLVNIPVGIIALWLVTFKFPPDPVDHSGKKTLFSDFPGLLLGISALSILLVTISRAPQAGWFSFEIIGGLVLSLGFFIAFLIQETRCRDPLLDWDLFKDHRFFTANLGNVFTSMLIGGFLFLIPFFLIYIKGMNEFDTGAMLVLFSGTYVVVSPLAGKLSDRIGARYLTMGGMGLAAVGLLLFVNWAGTTTLVLPIILLIVVGVSYGLYLSPNNRQILNLAPEGKQGSASGVIRLFFYLGQPIGVVLVESLIRGGIPLENPLVYRGIVPQTSDRIADFQNGFIVCGVFAAMSAICAYLSDRKRLFAKT